MFEHIFIPCSFVTPSWTGYRLPGARSLSFRIKVFFYCLPDSTVFVDNSDHFSPWLLSIDLFVFSLELIGFSLCPLCDGNINIINIIKA